MKFLLRIVIPSDKLLEVNVSIYDEHTYFLSPKTSENKFLEKEAPSYYHYYHIVDKNTGLVVCYTEKKKDLDQAYKSVYQKYINFMKTDDYKKHITDYQKLKGEKI